MRIKHRLERLEDRLQVGTNKDGTCRYCTGREKELGRVVVQRSSGGDDPLERLFPASPDPGPTPCPRCGKDMNTYVIIHNVDMIAKRRAEGGWLDAARERPSP